MNKFIKRLAALALAVVMLAGCSSNRETEGSLEASVDSAFVSGNGSAPESSALESFTGSTALDTVSSSFSEMSESRLESSVNSAAGGDGLNVSTGGDSMNSPTSVDNPNSSTGGTGTQSSQNGMTQTADKPSVAVEDFSFEWKTGNTWEENGSKCGTVELTVKNNSAKAVSSWEIRFNVPNGFKITNGWSGTYSVSGTTATVKNAEYNGQISAGGSIGIGFNYSSPVVFSVPENVTLNGTGGSSSGGSTGNDNQNNNGNGSQNNNDKNPNDPAPSEDVKKLLERSDKAVQGDDWLHTDGNRILDKNGKQVWITGVNWFGYNTGTNTFDGLWNSQMRGTVKAIADHGFNLIRVPISAELLNQWSRGEYPKANYNNASNPEMNAMNSLQIFDYFLKLAEENGMKVMPDIHCAETNAMGHNVNLWYTDKVSVDDYYHALEWLAERYKDNDTIIAIDIKNEPHGKPNEGSAAAIWNDSKDKNNWKYTAEQAAARILAKNPNVLIMVEGTEIYSKNNGSYSSQNSADYYFNWWGGNLRGVRDYPVNLGRYSDKLVYSPHDYGPTVYEQPWFQGGFDYNSLINDCWQDNWLYIHRENIAPLLIGEWGGFMREPNLKWMTCMRQLIGEYHLNHTFWCYNANSGDTGGLVLDDFTTWDTEKYNFVKEVLWQEGGKFVGLDHAIPLGANGITLSSAKGL